MPSLANRSLQNAFYATLGLLTIAVLIWSGIGPADRLTWWLEVLPVVIAVPILLALYPRGRLSWLF